MTELPSPISALARARDLALASASSVVETESLVVSFEVGKLVAVQVPIEEWSTLIEAVNEAVNDA